MTRWQQISNDYAKTLMECDYSMSDCTMAHGLHSYAFDLFSSDILRQVICQLPPKFHDKWEEFCFTLRRTKEPTLAEFVN